MSPAAPEPPRPHGPCWPSPPLVLLLALLWGAGAGCRVQSPDARWMPTHSRGYVHTIAANVFGVIGLSSDGALHRYPGRYGSWEPWGGSRARFIATGTRVAVTYHDGGALTLWRGPHDSVPLAIVPAPVSALSVNEDGSRVYVISEGEVRRVVLATGALGSTVCPGATPRAMAAAGAGIYVTDGASLFFDDGNTCEPVPAPYGIVNLAVRGDRMVAIDRFADIHERRRGQWRWVRRPSRVTPGYKRKPVTPLQVAATEISAWTLDDSGLVFSQSEAR